MDGEKRASQRHHSAGGLVVRLQGGAPQVAMIATKGKTRWGLPKGAVSTGETSEDAALREVLEETNLRCTILEPLETIEYFFRASGALIQKRVDFYLMRYDCGEIQPQLSEVDDAAWVDLSEALERSSFDSERKLLTRVSESFAQLTPDQRARIYG